MVRHSVRGEACLKTQTVLEINAGKAVFLNDRYKYSNPVLFQRAQNRLGTIKLQSSVTARKPRELLSCCHVGNSDSIAYFKTLSEYYCNSSIAIKATAMEFTGRGKKKKKAKNIKTT